MRTPAALVRLDPPLPYDGTQLSPHYLRARFGIGGDAAVLFRGPCHVDEALVDLEDREQGAFIHSRDMLHLIVELFGVGLEPMVLLQRLVACMIADRVRNALPAGSIPVLRRGDDVYAGAGKLTVGIATVSAVSGLLHTGINVTGEGAPVQAAGLLELGISPGPFAEGLLGDLVDEIASVIAASCKVRPVT